MFLYRIVALLLLNQLVAFNLITRTPFRRCCSSSINMLLGGLAERMGGIVDLISGQKVITEANVEDSLREIRSALIDADVNLQVANVLLSKVKEKTIGMKVEAGQKPGEQFISILAAEMVEVMGNAQAPLTRRSDGRPNVILLSGLQGAGKTTAAGKLASWAISQSYAKKILLVAGDIYRPAATEQLQTLGAQLNVDVFTESGVSPVQISRRAMAKAIAEGYDTVIIDTAGRQVVDEKLMDELKQIKAAVSPDETLLVVDAMTGQEAATLTARFNEDIGITGAILTKMDGDTRGGAALSVRGISGKPIKFVGVGEGMGDLEPFYPDRMVGRILGRGDIQSFLEKAQSAMDFDAAASAAKKMQKGKFDFNDYTVQMSTLRRMGGMSGMLKMIPGASKIKEEQLFAAEKRLKRSEIIINAMSDEEKSNPDLLCQQGGKRELVVAAEERRRSLVQRCGLEEKEINEFIFEFLGMRKMMLSQMKGIDVDAISSDPSAPMVPSKKEKKAKPSRGGGSGFGAR